MQSQAATAALAAPRRWSAALPIQGGSAMAAVRSLLSGEPAFAAGARVRTEPALPLRGG